MANESIIDTNQVKQLARELAQLEPNEHPNSVVKQRRQRWYDRVREELTSHLTIYVNSLSWLQLEINRVTEVRNLESVILTNAQREIGITLPKEPGKLVFQQTYTGRICIWMQTPYIQNLTPKPVTDQYGVFGDEDINFGFVSKVVYWYFGKLKEWEEKDYFLGGVQSKKLVEMTGAELAELLSPFDMSDKNVK